MIKIYKNFKPKELLMIFIAFILILIQVFLDLRLPDYMAEVTKLIQGQAPKLNDVLMQGLYMMLTVLGSVICSIIVGLLAAKVASVFGADLRERIFLKVSDFSMEEINKFSTPSLITRTTNDVNQIRNIIVLGLQVMLKGPIMAIWAISKIYNKNIAWSTLTLSYVILLLFAISIAMYFVMPKFKIIQELTDDINRVSRESLSGLRVIRAYNAESFQDEKFEEVNKELTDVNLFTSRVMSLMMPFIQIIMNSLTVGIYWIGAILIHNASTGNKLDLFSDMVVFSSYSIQVIMSFMMLIMIFVLLPRAKVSADRINEVLDTDISIIEGKETTGLNDLKGSISFENVSFKYPDAKECVLKDISFEAKQGETVAIIGSTASGKSTLIHLIPRFFDVTKGQIKINGRNVKDYTLDSLYNKIAFVPQTAVMFSGSVEDNVNFGKTNYEPNLEDIKEAIEIAQAKNFVENMDETYQAHIARGGTNISGGQKQRLSIARAINRKPEIFLFDDSFSALDFKTDRLLRTALKEHTKDTTSLIVAQRIGTIMDADKIIVLDNGQIVGMGSHQDLLKTCEVYQEIAASQLDEKELQDE